MNYLKILINDLKRLIKYNKITFFVVSVSMMFVTFGVLFYAGYIAYSYEKEESEVFFDVYLDTEVTKEKVEKLCDRLCDDNIIQMAVAKNRDEYESDDRNIIIGEYNIRVSFGSRVILTSPFSVTVNHPFSITL